MKRYNNAGFFCQLDHPKNYFIQSEMNLPEQDDGDQTVKSIPKVFANEALKKGPEFYDYESQQQFTKIIWQSGSIYTCLQKIGRGKYSQVFTAQNMNSGKPCIIKMLKPITDKKITREIKLLMALHGHENVVELVDLVKEGEIYCLVFQRIQNVETKTVLRTCTVDQGKLYMYRVLQGLHYCHSMGIMHRDVKPGNIIIDPANKKVKLIDWGLGEFYLPHKPFNVHVASRYYKAPQLLVDYEYYHYSMDIWSFGALLASFVFRLEPMFKGSDNIDQLKKIVGLLGSQGLFRYVAKYNMILDEQVEKSIGHCEPVPLSSYINEENKQRAVPEALDLLQSILKYDHDERPTAMECMEHPYFDEIRLQLQKEKEKGKGEQK